MFSQILIAQTSFSSFDELLAYATEQNSDLQQREIDLNYAKQLQASSLLGILDPQGNINLMYRNNLELPVTLVPGELVGGATGTTQEVQFGIQYETQFSVDADVKLFHLAGWSERQLAGINTERMVTNKIFTQKELYESLADSYYQILTLQQQEISAYANVAIADSLHKLVQLRFLQGLTPQQDVNEAAANVLEQEQTQALIGALLKEQYAVLKARCDVPSETSITINNSTNYQIEQTALKIQPNDLALRYARQQEQYTYLNQQKAKQGWVPTLSLFAYHAQQQNNEEARLFTSNSNWIPSTYVGLRLRLPIQGYQQHLSVQRSKTEYLQAQAARQQAEINTSHAVEQLQLAYEKARTTERYRQALYELRKDTYEKNLLSYQQGVLGLDHTLSSFQAMVTAEYSWIEQQLAIALAQEKINIHNTIN